MKYVYLALNWVFGVLCFLIGLASIITSPLAGLSVVMISLLLLPPARKFAFSKLNMIIPVKVRGGLIFTLFIGFIVFMTQGIEQKSKDAALQKTREKAEQIEKIEQENIAYFSTNKKMILSSANTALSAEEYQTVISQTNKYLASRDEELKDINSLAKTKLLEKQKIEKTMHLLAKLESAASLEHNKKIYQQLVDLHPEHKEYKDKFAFYSGELKRERLKALEAHNVKKTKELLTKLKSIPTKKYEKNLELYKQLVSVNPSNKAYKNKVKAYSDLIEKAKQKSLKAEARTKNIERQFSAWDGSHSNVERFIKEAMNDPSSYEHVNTMYWDKGDYLIIKTIYRGKNAFGGVVKNFVKVKVSLSGQLIEIIDKT